ncbi:MAG: plasmid stabilization protein [Armatimonadetes bacterium]|nr:plasmid stabilization protein [Armatimonadota bacterium]
MPPGDKTAYTDKQKRMAEHIEHGYEKKGVNEKEAERRAWATVNKETGGGARGGSQMSKSEQTAARSDAAKRGWVTRRKRMKMRAR